MQPRAGDAAAGGPTLGPGGSKICPQLPAPIMLGKTDISGGKDVVLLPPGKLSEWLLGVVLALLAGLIAWLLRRSCSF